jgi:hypothetical protein
MLKKSTPILKRTIPVGKEPMPKNNANYDMPTSSRQ